MVVPLSDHGPPSIPDSPSIAEPGATYPNEQSRAAEGALAASPAADPAARRVRSTPFARRVRPTPYAHANGLEAAGGDRDAIIASLNNNGAFEQADSVIRSTCFDIWHP